MKAMILAAGFGTRLRPITLEIPKALVPVQGRPMLGWVIDYLAGFGIREFVINLHYLPELIRSYVLENHKDLSFSFSFEEEILGTGGGIEKAAKYLQNENFILHNTDVLCNADLNGMIETHLRGDDLATLAINDYPSPSMLTLDEQMHMTGVKRILGEPNVDLSEGRILKNFCGIHIISPEIFRPDAFPFCFSIIDEYLKTIDQGFTIGTWDLGSAYWTDIGTLQSLQEAQTDFQPHRA